LRLRILLFLCCAIVTASSLAFSTSSPWQASQSTRPESSLTAQELEARADAFRSQKEYADALAWYEKAARKTPKNATLWNKMGMSALQLGRYDLARIYFQQAIKRNRHYAEAVNNLGVTYYLHKDYRRAISYYRKAVKIRDSASFHANLGAAYFDEKDFKLATSEYLRALQLDPEVLERTSVTGISASVARRQDIAQYAFMLARLYARVGDVDHSIAQLRRAMENGYTDFSDVYTHADFAAVRNDPRFTALMNSKPASIPQ